FADAGILLSSGTEEKLAFLLPRIILFAKPFTEHVGAGALGHLSGLLRQLAGLIMVDAEIRRFRHGPTVYGVAMADSRCRRHVHGVGALGVASAAFNSPQ